MAITITKQPYAFSPRGQKLLFIASSDNSSQAQFKYGVSIVVTGLSQTMQFYISPDPNGYFIFDLAAIAALRNEDETTDMHAIAFSDYIQEQNGKGKETYSITIEEWWNNAGTFTHNSSADEIVEVVLCNGVLQPSFGYKPNTNSSTIPFGYAMTSLTARAMSDRFHDTHNWWKASSFAIASVPEAQRTFIPCLSTDYGLLTVPTSTLITGNDVVKMTYSIFNSFGATYSYSKTISSADIIHVGIFPMNINADADILSTPANTNNWRYYQIMFQNTANAAISMRYIFYNAELWGQTDCRNDNVRLAWVNSRGGWDYFNFIKKNEWTNNAERKQYRQVLYRNAPNTFLPTDRQLIDRETIVRRTLQITSDWVQETEFEFLRNLFASKQVQIIQEDGTQVPVSIADTSFVEKRERNGKLYNVTLNVTPSQDYWT